MVWVLACALVIMFGGVYLFLLAREVWRKSVKLGAEVEAAAVRLEEAGTAVSAREQRVGSASHTPGGAPHA